MTRTSILVDRKHLRLARDEVSEKGPSQFLDAIAEGQPALAFYVRENLVQIAGKLALSGVQTEVVQGAHEDVLGLLLICVDAFRRAISHDTRPGGPATLDLQASPDDSGQSKQSANNTPEHDARRIGF